MTKRTTGTGRRLFKMTPLHHHFEMQDWKESKIVFRFLILAILFALESVDIEVEVSRIRIANRQSAIGNLAIH